MKRDRLPGLDTVQSLARSPADWHAGILSAVIMLPQAVILAALAGLPPEMGVYASVLPVIAAALLGSSGRLLSGPNTTVCVMISASLVPLATPASDEYVMLALVLSAMVGTIQVLGALCRAGRLFDAIPLFIVQGVSAGVGLVIIVSQLPTVLGVLSVPGQAPWLYLWHAAASLSRANPLSAAIALLSIVSGLLLVRTKIRWITPLVGALGTGMAAALLLDLAAGSGSMPLERIGHLSLQPLAPSLPALRWDELYIFKQLLISAVAIAFVGTLQTVIIARWIGALDGTPVRPDRELFAQGAANIVASLTSGFAGSGSFNRSAAHVHAGAQTAAAAVISAFLLFVLVYILEPVLAHLPTAAMAGTLILIGWGLLRASAASSPSRLPERIATWLVAAGVLAAGLEAAVFWASALALFCSLWRAAGYRSSAPPDHPMRRKTDFTV